MSKELKEIKSIDELPKKLQEELIEENTTDILNRYDHSEYHDPRVIDDFLYENGYKLK